MCRGGRDGASRRNRQRPRIHPAGNSAPWAWGHGLFLLSTEASRWGMRRDRRTRIWFEPNVSSVADRHQTNRREIMTDSNATILRRAYAAFNSGDMDTLIEIFDKG